MTQAIEQAMVKGQFKEYSKYVWTLMTVNGANLLTSGVPKQIIGKVKWVKCSKGKNVIQKKEGTTETKHLLPSSGVMKVPCLNHNHYFEKAESYGGPYFSQCNTVSCNISKSISLLLQL